MNVRRGLPIDRLAALLLGAAILSPVALHAQTAAEPPAADILKLMPAPDTTLPPPPTAADFAPLDAQLRKNTAETVQPGEDAARKEAETRKEAEAKAEEARREAEARAKEAEAKEAEAKKALEAQRQAEAEKDAQAKKEAEAKAAEAQRQADEAKRIAEEAARMAADTALREAIRARLAALATDPRAETRRDAPSITEFYSARQNMSVWTDGKVLNERARAVIARLARAAEDGLDPTAYKAPRADLGAKTPATADELAAAEVQLSAAVALYARHAQIGRVDPASISRLITVKREAPEPDAVLAAILIATDAGATLEAYNPPHEGYRALRKLLSETRAKTDMPVRISSGPILRPGRKDPRVAELRARFRIEAPADADPEIFDAATVDALKAFQREIGAKATGILTPNLTAALNRASGASAEADIVANMERWRWLPRELGQRYIMVNIPDFTLRVMKGDEQVHTTRVVVGKPENQTPVFSNAVQFVVVNPSWHVPQSIIRKEMVGVAAKDPTYFTRRGYEVTAYVNGRTRVIDPSTVDWSTANPAKYGVRQPPGERNALGRMKFMFPNQHAVYLHDTPSRSLFLRDYRAFSHGCVRVYEPLKFADVVFDLGSPGDGWDGRRLQRLFGGAERRIDLKGSIPVHLVYFTSFVDDAGTLQNRADLYGHNARLKAALGLNG